MKKKIIPLVFAMLLSLTACGKNDYSDQIRTYDSDEPTLSEEASDEYQFVYPVEGDLCADINILDYGHIYIKLFEEEAPAAVENFVSKARSGDYNGTKISAAVDGYYVQAGKPIDSEVAEESIWGGGFSNEISDRLFPVRGSVCMANQGEDGTNAMEFFFVTTPASVISGLDEPLRERYGMGLQDYLKSIYSTELSDAQLKKFTTYGGAPWIYGHNTVFAQIFDGFDVLDALEEAMSGGTTGTIYIKKITIYEHV